MLLHIAGDCKVRFRSGKLFTINSENLSNAWKVEREIHREIEKQIRDKHTECAGFVNVISFLSKEISLTC
jgi:hypothetical protein